MHFRAPTQDYRLEHITTAKRGLAQRVQLVARLLGRSVERAHGLNELADVQRVVGVEPVVGRDLGGQLLNSQPTG